jgi:ABC-type nitrate/sulfonate/bicarbonate transport system substrate-binding protein
MKIVSISLSVLLSSIALTGCIGEKTSVTPTAQPTDSNQKLTQSASWGGPKNVAMLPLIAESKGFFAQAGLDAKRQDLQTGKLAMDALNSGKLDIGILVDTNIAFGKFQPMKLKVVAVMSEKTDDAIVARKDKGITDAKQLVGKKIGVTLGTTSHAMAVDYLQKNNIALNSVTFVNQPPPALQAALIKGDIDAAALWQPSRFNAKATLQDNALELKATPPHKVYALVVVREDYAQQHKTEISQFLKALIQAEKYTKQNQQEAQSILSEQVGIPANVLSSSWQDYSFGVNMSKDFLASIEKQSKWIIESQPEFSQKATPQYSEVLAPEYLKEVDSSRVSGF